MKQNPYSLLFGKEPLQRISRKTELASIVSSFCADSPTQQVYMITGVRGSGKTVLMTEVTKKFRQMENWITVELNPERNLLEDLAAKLNSDNALAKLFTSANINLSFLGLGVDIAGVAQIKNIEIALEKMLESIKKSGKRLLITIDETINSPGMREFSHSFQMFIRQDFPLFLLMTGLYHNIDALQNEEGLTFLYRAPKIELQPLSIRTISDHYRKTFNLDKASADKMAKMTRGYSFAFQVLGYLTWENGGDYESVTDEYQRYLADYSYDKIWSELSAQDRKVAYGIAQNTSGKISEIRAILELDTNHFNPYRKRLMKRGLLNGESYGYVSFILPYFKEYILENYEL